VRNLISILVTYEVKDFTVLLGKVSTTNKIEGIQLYNRGTKLSFNSPSLKLDKFEANC